MQKGFSASGPSISDGLLLDHIQILLLLPLGDSDCLFGACLSHLFPTHQLEEGMAAHASILAWRIPMDREAGQTIVHGVAKNQT